MKLELQEHRKKDLKEILDSITKISQEDMRIYKILSSEDYVKMGEPTFYNYQDILDVVYQTFLDLPETEVYDMFRTPADSNKKKIIAWYETQYSLEGDGSIPGPKGAEKIPFTKTGFIPDSINTVILDQEADSKTKYKLLKKMFKDLVKLSKKKKG